MSVDTHDGPALASARAQGRIGGRPSVIGPDQLLGISRYRHIDVTEARTQG